MDPLIICYWLDDLSSDNFAPSKNSFLRNLGPQKRTGAYIYLVSRERFDIERVEAQIYFIDCPRRDHEDIRKFRIAADANFNNSAHKPTGGRSMEF